MGNKNKKINIKLNQELVTKETCKESKHLDVDKSRSQSQTDYSRAAPTLCETIFQKSRHFLKYLLLEMEYRDCPGRV